MKIVDDTAALREAMVQDLRRPDGIRTHVVAQAFLTVPRHLFTPDEPVELAYHPDRSAWPKHDENGSVTSTVSAAHIQAVMLEQAGLRPGMRVLEIGSGGYNAALMAEIVGADGEVTSVDIDPEIIDRARACLDAAGYPGVRTVSADADEGVRSHAPYDRIVVTVRSWDLPPAWVDQLSPGGRIVVPLRMLGLTRSVALDLVDGAHGLRLRGGDARLCSFVPMQGVGAHDERVVTIDGGVVQLRTENDVNLDGVASAIGTGLHGTRLTAWTGVEFDHVDDLDLWLAMWLPRTGILTGSQKVVDEGLLTAAVRRGVPALVSEGGFAYRTKRPTTGGGYETGVHAWGPDAPALAETHVEVVRSWGRYRRDGGQGPAVEVYASDTAFGEHRDDRQVLLRRNHAAVVLTWPGGCAAHGFPDGPG